MSPSPFAQKKGSILLTATIFATISMVIVASFIKLTNHELRLSNIQFYSNQALNLAEGGLDEAMHLLLSGNQNGWVIDGDDARFSARNLTASRGATGEIDVLMKDWDGNPVVIAEGRVITASGLTTSKQVQMTLRPRSYFANGITARCRIVFAGGVSTVQSFKSSEGMLGSPQHKRRDRASVATTSLEADLAVGNGHIWGYAFTGGGQLNVGPHGTVQGEDSPATPLIDPKRVARDFSAIFPRAIEPPGTGVELGTVNASRTLGEEGSTFPKYYQADNINMTGGAITIVGPVILVVRGDIKFSGGAELIVGHNTANLEKAELLLYAYNDVSFGGSGGMNNLTGIPNNLAIFGMGAEAAMCGSSQTFGLGGNASWAALVYAPDADITMNGGGNSGIMSGAVVGMNVRINGGSNFHYDEDVESFMRGFGWAMESWEEIRRIDTISFN